MVLGAALALAACGKSVRGTYNMVNGPIPGVVATFGDKTFTLSSGANGNYEVNGDTVILTGDPLSGSFKIESGKLWATVSPSSPATRATSHPSTPARPSAPSRPPPTRPSSAMTSFTDYLTPHSSIDRLGLVIERGSGPVAENVYPVREFSRTGFDCGILNDGASDLALSCCTCCSRPCRQRWNGPTTT